MSRNAAVKARHICKFLKHTFKTGGVTYFCANGCNRKVAPAFALGKQCICWRCGNEFTMTEYSIRLAKPHCDSCHRPRNPIEVPEVRELNPASLSLTDRIRLAVSNPIDEEGDI